MTEGYYNRKARAATTKSQTTALQSRYMHRHRREGREGREEEKKRIGGT